MSWSDDTDFEVIFTDDARTQLQNILDHLFFKLNNVQAAVSVPLAIVQYISSAIIILCFIGYKITWFMLMPFITIYRIMRIFQSSHSK